jgi:hypothetical protein
MPATAPAGDARDRLVASAKSMAELMAAAKAADPALAAQLTPKILVLTRSPPGVLLVGVLTWAGAKYGLQLDPALVDALAAAGVLIGGYAFRYLTAGPVGSIVKPVAAP